MRRPILVSLTVFLATALAFSISLLVSGISQAGGPDSGGFVSQGSVAKGPSLPKEDFPAYSQVVDNSSSERFKAPGWATDTSNPGGYREDYRVTKPSEGAKPAQFKVRIPATDVYSVYAWWPARGSNNPAARFSISTASGIKWAKINEQKDGGFWVKLGEYEMEAGDSYSIRVSPASQEEGYVVADAVAVVRGVLSAPPEASYEEAASGNGTYTASRTTAREGRRVVRVARNHIGTRYRHSPPHPCRAFRSEDCSCHTKVVFRRFDVGLLDSPVRQYKRGRWIARSNLRPGDLVFFKERGPRRPITHVGIFSGHGNLVHASSYWGKVVEKKMKYIKGYYGAKRININ